VSVSAHFVGRGAELCTVEESLRRYSDMVLVIGDAGIGKTRLAAEALARARTGGALTVAVGCLPLAEKLPLLPVADVFRELDQLADGRLLETALGRLPGYVRVQLARLLPRLAEPAAPSSGRDGAEDRERLYTAVAEVLLEVARRCPVVLLVEDVHWADGPTLDVLTYLRAVARGEALSLVVTCRSDEAPLGDLVVSWLAHARAAMATEVRLAPLSRDEVAEQAAGLVGETVPAAFADELLARAEGNPFLTEQLVAAAQVGSSGDRLSVPQQLPCGLVELLMSRVGHVGSDARAVLRALSVAGRPLTEQLLVEIAGLDDDRVRAALRELADAALLAPPAGVPGCRPRHALLAEAVIADLLPGERMALHACVAGALENTHDPALAAEVAAHWASADQPAAELRASVTASDAAVRVSAFAEAAALWQRVLHLCEELPDMAKALGLDLARLHVRAVDALWAAGRVTEAGHFAELALARFADWPDTPTAAAVHVRAAELRALRDPAASRPLFEAALRLFDSEPPSAEQAEALTLYSMLCRQEGRSEMALAEVRSGLRVAEAVGAVGLQARISANLAQVHFVRGDVEEGFAALRHGHALADPLDDVGPSMWVAVRECDALWKLSRLEEARHAAIAGVERARRGGQLNSYRGRLLQAIALYAMLERGDADVAARLMDANAGGAPQVDDWEAHVGRALVDLHVGRVEDSARRLAVVQDLPISGDMELGRVIVQLVVETALWRRAPHDALHAAEQLLNRLVGTEQELFSGELLVFGMRAAADADERARARGDGPGQCGANAAVGRLEELLHRMDGRPLEDHPYVARIPADRVGWIAERARAAGVPDPAAWEAVAREWERIRRPHKAAYAWWRCAEAVLTRNGRCAASAAPLRSAAEAARGMAPLRAAVERLARRARVDLYDSPATPAPVADPAPYALTPRERQVLRLLAEGRTNTQIGLALYISASTAGVHVTNILRRLGAANRTEAAAIAERAGLLDDADTG
jgi:DNA-binding CsgD family transcriptional regulator/tetratricopeptide (TPR) repeat protein